MVQDPAVRGRPFQAPLDEGLSEMDELIFAAQLASAMEHLASNGVIHGRLSTENVFISSYFSLKLGGIEFESNLLHRSNTIAQTKRTPSVSGGVG